MHIMKKLLSILMVIAVLLSIAACGADPTTDVTVPSTKPADMVTIYIPNTSESITYLPDGEQKIVMHYTFEEGWQNKESFTASVEIEDPNGMLGEQVDVLSMMKISYGEKYYMQETSYINRTETFYDENGRAIKQVTTYLLESAMWEKQEINTTYDAFGRPATRETKQYRRGEDEPTVTTVTYTYTETATGSEGRYKENGIEYVSVYDQNYRLLSTSTFINGVGSQRVEYKYDEAGNLIESIQYLDGEKLAGFIYTHTAVEVSAEFAERMPQFNKAQ
jgi:YD repeat-containing protein